MNKKKFIPLAKDVINLEIKALQSLKKKINSSFNEAVKSIAKCQSKVILCGVGKSGLIASKIAATLSSVGTPSFSLSAGDSSHGDLGSISKKDILILISNSGETTELKNIIQYAKRNKILLIGIVSKKDSILYRASDIKLLIPKMIEAGGIIPTASTTSQLALGDALAISSMHYKKFGKKDFKKLHPAGSLGAQTGQGTVGYQVVEETGGSTGTSVTSGIFDSASPSVDYVQSGTGSGVNGGFASTNTEKYLRFFGQEAVRYARSIGIDATESNSKGSPINTVKIVEKKACTKVKAILFCDT